MVSQIYMNKIVYLQLLDEKQLCPTKSTKMKEKKMILVSEFQLV